MRIRIRRLWGRADTGDLPTPTRTQRLILVGAALAITLVLGVGLLAPHVEFLRAKKAQAQPKACAPGQTDDCVGGTMRVIVAPAASAPR